MHFTWRPTFANLGSHAGYNQFNQQVIQFSSDAFKMSKYRLLSYFPENKNWFTYHIYCPECKYYMGNREDLPNTLACSGCQKVINDVKKAPYFLTLNLQSQLKYLFQNPLVQPHLGHRHNRRKMNENNIEDVYDGELYKQLSAPGKILDCDHNFSYIINTDGCQASDSSPVTVWPVFLKINELPLKIRNKNIVLAGIWVDKEKPTINTFLQPEITLSMVDSCKIN